MHNNENNNNNLILEKELEDVRLSEKKTVSHLQRLQKENEQLRE